MNFFTNGTTQAERLSPNRCNADIPIVDSSQTDFLNFVQDFSSILHYWNSQGNIEGNWQPFFHSDVSFVLADISRYDINPSRKKARSLKKEFLATHQPALQEQLLISLYAQLLDSAESLGLWYQRISEASNTDSTVADYFLEIAQSNLDRNLLDLIPIFDSLSGVIDTSPNVLAKKNIANQSAIVSHLLSPIFLHSNNEQAYPGNGLPTSLLNFWQCYDEILLSLLTTITQILQSVPSYLTASLNTPNHSPQVSLLLAFYKMLEPAREQLNDLSSRHHQFYFQRILQQSPQSYTADQTFLTFENAPHQNAFLPAGTQFSAGTSAAGIPIIYQTEHELSTNQVKPISFKTLYNGTTSPELKQAVTGSISANPVANSGNGLGSKLVGSSAAWPTFGKANNNGSDQSPENTADLGFAISSSSLFYSDGNRRIRFIVYTSPQDLIALSTSIEKLDWPSLVTPSPNPQLQEWESSLQKITALEQALKENTAVSAPKETDPKPADKAEPTNNKDKKAPLYWTEKEDLTQGVNVSSLDGEIQWHSLLASEIGFTFVRATLGSETDLLFNTNWTELETLQIVRGAYHQFSQPKSLTRTTAASSKDLATEQAKQFLSAIGTLQTSDLPPALSVTEFEGAFDLQAFTLEWLKIVEASTFRIPILLTTPEIASQVLVDPKFSHYPLWISEPGVNSPEETFIWKNQWTIWQYSVHATVSGITSHQNSNLNAFNGSTKDLQKLIQNTTIVPTIKPSPDPVKKPAPAQLEQEKAPTLKPDKPEPKKAAPESMLGRLKNFFIHPKDPPVAKITVSDEHSSTDLAPVTATSTLTTDTSSTKASANDPAKPSPQYLQSLEQLIQLIHEIEESFREDLQACLVTISQISKRKPVPLSEWLDAAINFVDFKIKYHLLKTHHQPQAEQAPKSTDSATDSAVANVLTHSKDLEKHLVDTLSQKKSAIENLSTSLAKKATGSIVDSALKSLNLGPLKNAISSGKVSSAIKEASKFTHLTNKFKKSIRPEKKLEQGKASDTHIQALSSSAHAGILQKMNAVLDSSVSQKNSNVSSLFSLQWLTEIGNVIHQAELQLIHSGSESLLISGSSETIQKLDILKQRNHKAAKTKPAQPTDNNENSPAKSPDSPEPAELEHGLHLLQLAHQGTSHIENLWNNLSSDLSTHIKGLSDDAQKLLTHPISGNIHELLNLLPQLNEKSSDSQKSKLAQVTGGLSDIKTTVHLAAEKLTGQASTTSQKAADTSQTITLQKEELANTIHKTKHAINLRKVTPAQNSPISNTPQLTSSPSLISTLKDIEKRLQCWQPQSSATSKTSTPVPQTTPPLPEQPDWLSIEAVLKDAFVVDYSGAKGWNSPSDTAVTPIYVIPENGNTSLAPTEMGFEIELTLDSSAQAPASWTEKSCGGSYQNDCPVFRATLNQEVLIHFKKGSAQTINPYPLLAPLTFQEILIWGDVSQSSNYSAQNQLSQLKPSKPFALFGEQPVQGAEFYLGNCESLRKNLSYFISDINWYDLPKDSVGFAQMYNYYNRFGQPDTCYDNGAFLWKIDFLNQGEWQPIEPQKLQPFAPQSDSKTQTKNKFSPMFEWTDLIFPISPYISFTPPDPIAAGLTPEEAKIAATNKENEANSILTSATSAAASAATNETNAEAASKAANKILQKAKASESTAKDSANKAESKASTANANARAAEEALTKATDAANKAYQTLVTAEENALQETDPLSTIEPSQPNNLAKAQKTADDADAALAAVQAKATATAKIATEDKAAVDLANAAVTTASAITKEDTVTASEKQQALETATHKSQLAAAAKIAASKLLTDATTTATTLQTTPSIPVPIIPPLPQMSPLNVGTLLPSTLVILDPSQTKKTSQSSPSAFSPTALWDTSSPNGFLRFTLQTPQQAFGAQQYSDILASINNSNISRIIDLATFRSLTETQQNALVTIWEENKQQAATSAIPTKKSTHPHHSALGSLVKGLAKEAESVALKGLTTAEKAASLDPSPIVKIVGGLVHGLTNAALSPHSKPETVDPTKLFAPLKPPPLPWVPKVKSISLSYGHDENLSASAVKNEDITFYQIHPFGISKPLDSGNAQSQALLPSYKDEGCLFIGLEEVTAPQTVTLLFILDEASGNPRLPIPQPTWSFLRSDGWKKIPETQVHDGTGGFIKSGIISLTLLQPANTTSELFLNAPSLYWLRVSLPNNVSATCQTVSVTSQATSVSYLSGADTSTHFNAPLPAESIKKIVIPIAGLLKTIQPITSFGGVAPETPIQFHTRVSERLRHKDRAITIWDFENLVLQKFGKIQACKTLNSTTIEHGTTPGAVTILIFQQINSNVAPLSPLADRATLVDITNYLSQRCDPFLKLSVVNPDFLFTLISADITLKPDCDPSHYLQVLNQSLTQELAPWILADPTINPFAVSHTYDSLLQFISAQPYIETVADLQISLVPTQGTSTGGIIQQQGYHPLTPPNLWTLLSSVNQHNLTISTGAPKKSSKKKPLVAVTPKRQTASASFIQNGNSIFLGAKN